MPGPSDEVLDAQRQGEDGLDAKLAESYCCLKRVHLLGNVPYAVMYLYIDNRYYVGAADRFNRGPPARPSRPLLFVPATPLT